MTSHEGGRYSSFAGIIEPSFNAISYTWGRFEIENGPKIPLKGVTWKILSIDPQHFSVAEFWTAIDHAANGSGFIWLDIAYIDQESSEIKLQEIKKQASIFQRATKVYAWMAPWRTEDMLQSVHVLDTIFISGQEFTGDGGYRVKTSAPSPTSVDRNTLHSAIADITTQRWFTSLWTLQEAYLCSPWIMSRSSGELTLSLTFRKWDSVIDRCGSLAWITHRCSQIWRALQSDSESISDEICAMIIDSGILSLSSRNKSVLYRAAAKRQSRLPEDAVYGIMQVYDIQMPAFSNVDRLLVDFGFVLNSQSALESQLFVHEDPVVQHQAWSMSRKIYFPLLFTLPLLMIQNAASITADSRRKPRFNGTAFHLQDMLSFWNSVQINRRQTQKLPFHPQIYLDATAASEPVFIHLNDDLADPDPTGYDRYEDRCTKRIQIADLESSAPLLLKECRVLYLGTVNMCHETGELSWDVYYGIGLLVRQDIEGRTQPWFRVGFCSFLASSRSINFDTGVIRGEADDIPLPPLNYTGFECRIG